MVDLLMPRGAYMDVRADEFALLAGHAKVRPLELRVALSNVFVAMAGRRRQPFATGGIVGGTQRIMLREGECIMPRPKR